MPSTATTSPKTKNILGLTKRTALQFMATVSGALRNHFDTQYNDDFNSSVWMHEIAKAYDLLGHWQSPLPSTIQLLNVAAAYKQSALETTDPALKAVCNQIGAMLRVLGTCPSPAGAVHQIDMLHIDLLDALERHAPANRWLPGFRSSRIKVVKKLMAELP